MTKTRKAKNNRKKKKKVKQLFPFASFFPTWDKERDSSDTNRKAPFSLSNRVSSSPLPSSETSRATAETRGAQRNDGVLAELGAILSKAECLLVVLVQLIPNEVSGNFWICKAELEIASMEEDT